MKQDEDPRAVRVNVLDEAFRIQSEADEKYTKRVAKHVDGALRELRRSAPTLEPFQTAVLGAMGISDELFQARAQLEELNDSMVERLQRIERLVDEGLAIESGGKGADRG